MPRYIVNGTVTVAAWVEVVASSPELAVIAAKDHAASDWETDPATATVDFNVSPQVEEL